MLPVVVLTCLQAVVSGALVRRAVTTSTATSQKILAMGDGRTLGLIEAGNLTTLYPYTAWLQKRFPKAVFVNDGQNISTTQDMVGRMKQDLSKTKYDVVLLLAGGDDIMRAGNFDPNHSIGNIKSIISECFTSNPNMKVVLMTLPAMKDPYPVSPVYDNDVFALNKLIRSYSQEGVQKGVYLLDIENDQQLYNNHVVNLFQYYNATGYERLATLVGDFMVQQKIIADSSSSSSSSSTNTQQKPSTTTTTTDKPGSTFVITPGVNISNAYCYKDQVNLQLETYVKVFVNGEPSSACKNGGLPMLSCGLIDITGTVTQNNAPLDFLSFARKPTDPKKPTNTFTQTLIAGHNYYGGDLVFDIPCGCNEEAVDSLQGLAVTFSTTKKTVDLQFKNGNTASGVLVTLTTSGI